MCSQSERALNLTEFEVRLVVDSPHDYLSMNFTVQKREDSSIYFTMPPPEYSARAYIFANKAGYLESDPLIIDNSFYWEKIATPDLEYIASHTFQLKPSDSGWILWLIAILTFLIVAAVVLSIFKKLRKT